jgi:hypothetical protein
MQRAKMNPACTSHTDRAYGVGVLCAACCPGGVKTVGKFLLRFISEEMKQGLVASRQPSLRRLNFVHPLNAPSILLEPDGQQKHSHLSNKNMNEGACTQQGLIAIFRGIR